MNAAPDYKRFQFRIADLLAVMTMVALLLGTSRLPVSVLRIISSLAVLYIVKYRILTLRVKPWLGLLLYFLIVAALLPYLAFSTLKAVIDLSLSSSEFLKITPCRGTAPTGSDIGRGFWKMGCV